MRITNKKAPYEYEIIDRLEAGVHLTGPEVKSIRGGHAKLEGAFVKLMDTEAYLINAHVYPYAHARIQGYDPVRTRKLLLHKKQLITLKGRLDGANLTLIPLSWYTKGPLIKLEIGLAKGRKQHEKRDIKRREDQKRELERDYRGKIK